MNHNDWNWKLVGVDNVLLVLLPQSRLSIRIRLTKTVEQDQYLTALHKRFACRVLPDKIDHFLGYKQSALPFFVVFRCQ